MITLQAYGARPGEWVCLPVGPGPMRGREARCQRMVGQSSQPQQTRANSGSWRAE